jgi:uncharacterized phiE125 gp8 family phage protein
VAEPVTLAEAKQQTRMVEDDSQDTFLTSLIAPARAYVERYTYYSFVGEERTATFNTWGDFLEIARRPIVSVDEIVYSTTNDPADDVALEDFIAPIGRYPLRIYPYASFPALLDGGTITVTYTTGAVATTSEEYRIGKRAMLLLIGHWFETREGVALGQASNEVDFAVRDLLDKLAPLSAY